MKTQSDKAIAASQRLKKELEADGWREFKTDREARFALYKRFEDSPVCLWNEDRKGKQVEVYDWIPRPGAPQNELVIAVECHGAVLEAGEEDLPSLSTETNLLLRGVVTTSDIYLAVSFVLDQWGYACQRWRTARSIKDGQ